MPTITSLSELKSAIELLEQKQDEKALQLKGQFYLAYESLRPVNILKSSLHELVTSPSLTNDVLGTVIALASGFLSRKVIQGKSGNLIRKLIGSLIQLGVTNIVAQHPDIIKAIGRYFIDYLFNKQESKPVNH